MMAWLRTAAALIGFGFAIVQYLNHLQQIPGARPAYLPTAPEYLGLALISCGVLVLVFRFGISVDRSLPVGRIVRTDRRADKGGNAIAGHCGSHPPHLHRPVRLFCRVVAYLARKRETTETNKHFRNHPTNERRSRWLIQSSSQAEHRRHLGR